MPRGENGAPAVGFSPTMGGWCDYDVAGDAHRDDVDEDVSEGLSGSYERVS